MDNDTRTAGAHVAWARSTLLSDLSADDHASLHQVACPVEMTADSVIFTLGDTAQRLLIIESGTVALTLPFQIGGSSRELTIDQIGSGQVCGWSALVPPHRFTRSARAVTDVKLVGFDRTELEGVFASHRQIQAAMLSQLNRVIAGRLSRLEALLLRKLQRSVAHELGL